MINPILSALAVNLASSLGSTARNALAGARRRSQLATLVLQALELDAKQNDQSLEYPSGTSGSASPGELDALLPDGLGSLAGPLGVELWFPATSTNSAELLLERLERSSAGLSAQRDLAGLLVIHSLELADPESQRVKAYLDSRPTGAALYVWGPNDIAALIERHKEKIGALLPELAIAPLRAELQGPEPDWRSQSSARLGRLKAIYRTEGVVLALGAGVSMGMGLPDWDELVSALFVSLVTKQLTESIDEEQALELADAARRVGNESPLLSARYLRRG